MPHPCCQPSQTASSAHLLRSSSCCLIDGRNCALVALRLGCVQVNGTSNVLFTVAMLRSSNYRLWLFATQPETDNWADAGSSGHMQFLEHAGICQNFGAPTSNPPDKSSRALLSRNTAGKLKRLKSRRWWRNILKDHLPSCRLYATADHICCHSSTLNRFWNECVSEWNVCVGVCYLFL